jgi:hypothetical protein
LQIDWQYTVIYCGYVRLFVFQFKRIKFFAIFLWVVEPRFMKNCLGITKLSNLWFYKMKIRHLVLAQFFGTGIMVLEIFNPGSGTGITRFLKLLINNFWLKVRYYKAQYIQTLVAHWLSDFIHKFTTFTENPFSPTLAGGIEHKSS